MPIYAYKCSACGFAKDTLQKMSDAPLTVCPSCGASTFKKQLTAAGFKLKGTGWYVTDFRDEGAGKKEKGKEGETHSGHGEHSESHPSAEKSDAGHDAPGKASEAKPAAAAASGTPAPASSPPPARAPAPSAAPAAKTD